MDVRKHVHIYTGLREPLAIREGKHGIFVANLQWEEVRGMGKSIVWGKVLY